MNSTMKVMLGILAVMLFIPILVLVMWVSAHNSETGLRNQFVAQQKTNESSFDKLWKTISQEANIAETERDSFRKTYSEIMQSQKGVAGNGSLASFLTQSKVDITPDLFKKLMSTIESQRESFHRDQQKLLDIKREHDNVLQKLPSSLFVGSRTPLEAKLVLSKKTDDAFNKGQDDDLKIFKN